MARDEFAKVVAAAAKLFPCGANPLMAEAMVAWHALQLGSGMGYSHVIPERRFFWGGFSIAAQCIIGLWSVLLLFRMMFYKM